MAKVGPNMREKAATSVDDEIRVKASGSTVIKVSGGLPSSSSSSSQKSVKPEVADKQEPKQRKVSGQHSRNLSKSDLPAAAAALAAEKNKNKKSDKNQQKRSDPDESRQNPEHPVPSVDYGVVSGSSPVPPPAPPMPKTTHFNSSAGNGVNGQVNQFSEPETSAPTLSATNGAARLISQTPLNQSFESEESSNGGYGKASPDPIISKKRYCLFFRNHLFIQGFFAVT